VENPRFSRSPKETVPPHSPPTSPLLIPIPTPTPELQIKLKISKPLSSPAKSNNKERKWEYRVVLVVIVYVYFVKFKGYIDLLWSGTATQLSFLAALHLMLLYYTTFLKKSE
jgi:hypothetical protein